MKTKTHTQKSRPIVLLTGATGRLGCETAAMLQKKGFTIKAAIRDEKKAKQKLGACIPSQIEFIKLDLETSPQQQINNACKGALFIVHTAAQIREEAGEKKIFSANKTATQKLVCAAKKAKAKRFILISSTNVYGQKNGVVREEDEKKPTSQYGKSKLEAEREVETSGLQYVILRPCQIYGPQFLQDFKPYFSKTKNPFSILTAPQGHFNLVHVKDVANAIMLGIETKNANQAYNICNPLPPTRKKFLQMASKILDSKTRIIAIPQEAAFIATMGIETALKILGKKSGLTLANLKEAGLKTIFSTENAQKNLGWQPKIKLENGLREMLLHTKQH